MKRTGRDRWISVLSLAIALLTAGAMFLWSWVWSDFPSLALWEAVLTSLFAGIVVASGGLTCYVIGNTLDRTFPGLRPGVRKEEDEEQATKRAHMA